MSLILEALRKSEQQRRLGETPTLATDSAWAARRWRGGQTRAARWPWIALLVLLAGGGVAAWWRLVPRGDTTAGAPASAAAEPASAIVATSPAPPTAATAPAAQTPSQVEMPSPPQPMPESPAVAAATPTTAPSIDPSIRLSVPTPSVDGEYPEVPAPAEQVATTLAPSPGGPVEAPVSATSAQVPAAPGIAPPPVADTPPSSPPTPAATPTIAAPAVESSGGSDVPPVYALSLAIRQSLPPLKLSMHVWNADPARRFVILGETRATEGETAASDLRIVEIRRDGVVLDFRGTQFLLPRGGY